MNHCRLTHVQAPLAASPHNRKWPTAALPAYSAIFPLHLGCVHTSTTTCKQRHREQSRLAVCFSHPFPTWQKSHFPSTASGRSSQETGITSYHLLVALVPYNKFWGPLPLHRSQLRTETQLWPFWPTMQGLQRLDRAIDSQWLLAITLLTDDFLAATRFNQLGIFGWDDYF